ncbi:sodium:solute symporter family protein [Aminivibrio sp.]|uniref:sodium:solute symporter family protein n=1 Tax=Aminivibrio sp. TaxID=1872489 RepID=UPI001A3FBBB1|nr:sodium:solute symporter family protein [Aminivibrio sp.]MBL3540269.1 sodium:solute symporter family protein [Aminivibrio sp.]
MSIGMQSFIVIVAYLFILLGVTLYSVRSQSVKNVEGFFLANRGVSSVLLPLTMIAAMQSTFAFLGAPGMYYLHGVGFIVLVLSQGWCALMVIYFGSKINGLGRKYGYMTIGDYFEDRFDSRFLKVWSAAISALMTVVFLAMQYVGSARAIDVITRGEVPYIAGLAIIAFFSLLYVVIGGAKSVVLTDAIQAVILIVGIVIAAWIAVGPSGGIVKLFTAVAEKSPELLSRPGPKGLYNDKNWMMQFIVLPFGIWLCPHVWMRSLMAKDAKAIANSAMSIPLSQIVIYATATLFIGLSGHVLLTGQVVPDTVLPMLMNKYTNWFVASVIIAASLAAGLSTINSMILVSSQLFSQDIYKLFKGKMEEGQNLRISRILTVFIVLLGVGIALRPPQALVSVVIDVAYTGLAQLAPAFILGLYWRKCNRAGVTAGMTVGILILFYTRVMKIAPMGYPGFLWAFFANLLLVVLISMMTKGEEEERLNRFFAKA